MMHLSGQVSRVAASLDELRGGAGRLADLAEETKGKLAASDQALELAKAGWQVLRSAGAFESFADKEVARSKAVVSSFAQAGEDVAYAAGQYERIDGENATSLAAAV
ncbi:MAG: glycogen synthase [Segniliparus sp.]|uniref:glycogen synthase n=1 Tax=Segniliparus sp. TaxID=2804064 RepID=UPI003F3B787A